MWGMSMQLRVGKFDIILRAIEAGEEAAFLPGFQHHSVQQYLSCHAGHTLADEAMWQEKTTKDEHSVVWGIFIREADGTERLIGSTGLHGLEGTTFRQATTGIVIVDTDLWGKGIASACHKARTRYAFEQLDLIRLKSAAYMRNQRSKAALEKVGYLPHSIERNHSFINGTWMHLQNMECINPFDTEWERWWRGDRPTKAHLEARKRTLESLEWAKKQVKLL